MSINKRIFAALLCCLIQLFLCRNIDSERLVEQQHSGVGRHLHRKRSLIYDPRYLGFYFEIEPESTSINDSGFAIFHCKYRINSGVVKSSEESSNSEVRIEWRKDGTIVDHLRSSGRIRTLENGSLTIENAGVSDEGIYQCAVIVTSYQFVSSVPWIFLSRRVTLHSPLFDRFEYQPIDQNVAQEQKAAFRCVLNSKPPATIEWYKDNIRLKTEERTNILPVSQTLILSNVTNEDAGNYKCVARNGVKSRVSQPALLQINEGSSVAGSLSVVLEPRSQVLPAGESFILECLLNGLPSPKIHWLYNSLPIVAGNRTRFVGFENTSLLIEHAELSDSGTYICRAENDEDRVDLPTVVTIRTPPRITTAPKDEATQETLDVEFECMADGVPKPRITWYKNGEVIVPSEYFVIASNRLKVFGLVKDDQGVYQCFAENDMGSAQASAQLLVDAAASHLALIAGNSAEERKVPLQPLGLQANDITSRSVALKWDRPLHSADVSLYHIFYREEDSTSEKLTNSSTNAVIVSSLQPNTRYVIRVAGENGAGLGKASESIRILTKREGLETVPGKVRNLRAEVLGSETIKVDWDSPSLESGSEANRYRLFYIKANTSEDEHETRVLLVKTSYTLHSMEKFTKYFIRVEAEGANGVGLTSDQLEVTTYSDVPSGPPKNIRLEAPAPKVIRVRWNSPDFEHRNGLITGFKIRYKTKRKGAKGNVAVVEGDPGVYVIEDVEPGSHYTVRIAAMTVNGTGIFSDWFGIDTPMEEREETQIAGAPSELRVHAGHDSVQVSWLPPREDSVMIRGYLIGWGVNIPDVEKTNVDATVRHYTIKGLKPSREYVISLRAFNNVGNGFPIYETVKTTAYGFGSSSFQQPDKIADDLSNSPDFRKSHLSTPVGVIAEPISASAIRLSWTDPNDGFNQYYTVRYSSSSDNNGQVRQFNTSETEFAIDGLKPNTQYEFAVKLVESSQWSMSAVNKTFASPPSSAPRDLSIFAGHDNLHTVTLSWQPPKYANGEIEEYIVLYSDKLDLSDKDWVMDSVKGDRLSMTIPNLLPVATYYFKIQARNVKGYGPLSPVATYSSLRFSGDIPPRKFGENVHRTNEAFYVHLGQLLTTNFIYVLIGIISVVLLFLIVVLMVICVQRKSFSSGSNSKKSPVQSSDYMEGRKHSISTLSRLNNNNQQQPDLWIQQLQNGGRFAALNNGREISVDFMETPQNLVQDMKRFGGGVQQTSTESPPPRYQTLQGGVMSQSFHSQSSIYGCSPLVRHNRQRKSLPPRISTSVLSSISPSPAHTSPNQSTSNPHQNVPPNCCGVMDFCTNTAFSERGSHEAEDRCLNYFPCEQFSPQRTALANENKRRLCETDRLANSKLPTKKLESTFSGVGIPTIPLVASAKRCLTAKLKQPISSCEKDVRVKTVNFSPEVSVNEDDFCWQRQPQYDEHCSSKDDDDGGTLSRSYHQSSASLEIARQKTPQILYTGVNRHPIAKVDFAHSDHGSQAGSSTMLQMNNTPPPSSLNGGGSDYDHYNQTVRGMNPLKSFAQMGGAPPPMSGCGSPYLPGSSAANEDQRKTAHIVRPVVFASPTFRNSCANGKPAGLVIGQKSSLAGKLPVGRATAQPRVNVSERIYSPYSTVRVTQEGVSCKSEVDGSRPGSSDRFDDCDEMKPLKPAQSAEDINEIENNEFDHMIDTLQQLQQEFTER